MHVYRIKALLVLKLNQEAQAMTEVAKQLYLNHTSA